MFGFIFSGIFVPPDGFLIFPSVLTDYPPGNALLSVRHFDGKLACFQTIGVRCFTGL